MPKRIPVQSVVLFRDGKQVVPEIGKPFDFTQKELEEITSMNKEALSKIATRDLSEDDAAELEAGESKLKAELSAKGAKTQKGEEGL